LQTLSATAQTAYSGEPEEVVRVAGPGVIGVAPESRLAEKLEAGRPRRQTTSAPALTVTGSVVARLDARKKPGGVGDDTEDHWDFATPDLAATYGDWVKARADLEFVQKQAAKIRQLTKVNVDYLTAVAKRKAKLQQIGDTSEETKEAAEADRLKAEIQGEKDIFEAETAVRNAARTRDLLERSLLQAGIDPDLLERPERGVVLVVADVPEVQSKQVWAGQPCEARFFALPDKPFDGKVSRVGPSLSKERRTLRVIFKLGDPAKELLPGMFADIGLGTERRDVLTIPAGAVLHSGRSDYVLVRRGADEFRVVEVEVGEPSGGRVPVKSGVKETDEVVGEGAILLKPAAVRAIRARAANP
jgi:hypothetical protein